MFSSFLGSLGFTQNLADFFQCGCFGLAKPCAVDWTSQYTMVSHPAKEKVLRSVWRKATQTLWCVHFYVSTLWSAREVKIESSPKPRRKHRWFLKPLGKNRSSWERHYAFSGLARWTVPEQSWQTSKKKHLFFTRKCKFLALSLSFFFFFFFWREYSPIMEKMYFQILCWLFQNSTIL